MRGFAAGGLRWHGAMRAVRMLDQDEDQDGDYGMPCWKMEIRVKDCEKLNTVICYYQQFETNFSKDSEKFLELWKKSWESKGWNSVVLGENDAKQNPLYSQIDIESPEANFYKTGGGRHWQYQRSCYLRLLAYCQYVRNNGVTLYADYDVINYSFTPDILNYMEEDSVLKGERCAVYLGQRGVKDIEQALNRFDKNPGEISNSWSNKNSSSDMHVISRFTTVFKTITCNLITNERSEKNHTYYCQNAGQDGYMDSPLVHYDGGTYERNIPKECKRVGRSELVQKLRPGLAQPVIRMDRPRPVPVFLHIPRCGGTFVLATMMAYSVFLNQRNQSGVVMQILVNEGEAVFRVIASCREDIGSDAEDRHKLSVNLGDFFEILPKLKFVFSVVIEPAGISRFAGGLFHEICDRIHRKPMFFTCLRDPFEGEASKFAYLRTKLSEDSFCLDGGSEKRAASALAGMEFEEYIQSDRLSDSWLIRTLLPQATHIRENEIDEACQLLSDFRICGLSGLSEHLGRVLKDCYGEIAVPPGFEINSNSSGGVAFDIISEKARAAFLEKTKPDYELYRRLIARAEC